MQETYFTCTLGQAAQLDSRQKDFTNIPDFLEQRVSQHGDRPAVGFYIPGSEWETKVLTFQEVQNGTKTTAKLIADTVDIRDRQTVAFICSSNVEFLLVWLALMKLGHAVLHIAPQCPPNAIVALCKQGKVSHIFHDDVHKDLAGRSVKVASEEDLRMSAHELPFSARHDPFDMCQKPGANIASHPGIQANDIAYLHHTSGTSSGIPKPIPQSHKAGAGVQAEFDGSQHATFTTTPLYHGGIADLFRAWTSNALIWLFPGKDLPITAISVVQCLNISKNRSTPPICYFSSVPYVLEMMASHAQGLKHLQAMDIVGVGGAALPVEIGDRLVQQDVSLVSRYGSAECGFLMSSHRDYAKDKEWQYVRPGKCIRELHLEQRDDGLAELIVLPGWPHMAKKNRENGSFATADLFQPHPKIPNAWRYHSRADAQLSLVTGKKFDPSPVELSIAASTSLLTDVLVFGNGKPYPGALLFRSKEAKDVSDQDLVNAVASMVEKLNAESQSHARLPRNMLIPKPFSDMPLEKSSKGTILRNQAEAQYATDIEAAYRSVGIIPDQIADGEVEHRILELVRTIMASSGQAHSPDAETDLFAYGVDSVACLQIRHALNPLVPKGLVLPMTVVQDAGTVQTLARKILNLRHGKLTDVEEDRHQLMRVFVDQYGGFPAVKSKPQSLTASPANADRTGMTVLLTGATGSIGSHVLSKLVCLPHIERIHLLLRGSTHQTAQERVRKSLAFRGLSIADKFEHKISIHTCILSETDLGLADDTYNMLMQTVDVIYHLAWSVDFLLPLGGFKQHFSGLRSLLRLSLGHTQYATNPAQLIFCSSTASVSSFSNVHRGEEIPERILDDPNVSGGVGYSQSKWVAENMCLRACQEHPELREYVKVVRVGQVSGDTIHGAWNQSEAYPLMLSSAKVTGCLPDLAGEFLSWIPVDVAAACFVDLAIQSGNKSGGSEPALHVLNQDRSATWGTLLDTVCRSGQIEVLGPDDWLRRLAAMRSSDQESERTHPSLQLLEFWENAYGSEDIAEKPDTKTQDAQFAMIESRNAMPSLSKAGTVDGPYIQKLWTWIKENT